LIKSSSHKRWWEFQARSITKDSLYCLCF
jgi:hypothetical protein